MRIIGICGYKGSGKSEVAKYLIYQHGFVRFPFARLLKDMLRTLGLSEAQVDGDQKEVPSQLLGGKTPRWAMQSLGTEWGRACIDADLWVRAWKAAVPMTDVVVDDLRFPNEAQTLRTIDATLWRIERPGTAPVAKGWRKLLHLPPKVHPSEAHVGKLQVDRVIQNDRTIEGLKHEIDIALAWTRL